MAMIRSRNTVVLLLALSVYALPLCRGDIDIARPDDLIHLGNGFGTIGKCRNRLRATYRKQPIHPGNGGSGQDH